MESNVNKNAIKKKDIDKSYYSGKYFKRKLIRIENVVVVEVKRF